jgi:hypothetical protein
MHPKGKYVLGRPPVQRVTDSVTIVKQPVGTGGDHRIEFREPRDPQPNQIWFATADQTRAAYAEFGEDGPSGRVRTPACSSDH